MAEKLKTQRTCHSVPEAGMRLRVMQGNNEVFCHSERSEGGRRPLLDLETTQDFSRHPELVSGSHHLAPWGEVKTLSEQSELSVLGEGCGRSAHITTCHRGTRSVLLDSGASQVSPCHRALVVRSQSAAFTLAEVLITLAIIGVVAALTIPSLIENHNEKAWSTAKDLWDKKLTETVRRMNTDGVMTGHTTTESFMDSFKQYVKVIKSCDNSDINKCYSPKVVTTGKKGDEIEVTTSDLKTAQSMGIKDWGTNTESFVIADGTTVILAYNPECPYADPIEDTGSQLSCLGMMIDVNGKKGPNRVGKDIKLTGGVYFSTCDNPIGDLCLSTDFITNITIDTCNGMSEYDPDFTSSVASKYNSNCSENYWAGAKKACADKGMSLPTMAQLAQIASTIYGTEIGETEAKEKLIIQDAYKNSLTYNDVNGLWYWSSDQYPHRLDNGYTRSFYNNRSTYVNVNKCRPGYAVCISN